MKNHYIHTRHPPELRSAYHDAIVASGFWLRVGFLGVSAVAISLLMLFDGDARPVNAVAGALAGAVVAAFAWRRSWLAIARADAVPADGVTTVQSVPVRPIGLGQSVGTAAHR
jgi:hypothetical protein